MCDLTQKQLGDIARFEYGKNLPDSVRKQGRFNVYGSNGVVGTHSTALCNGPGIIVGRKGSAGAITWSEEPFWAIDTTYFVVPTQDLDLKWLFYSLSLLGLHKLDSSTGVPGLNRNDAYPLRVWLPSTSEQRAITTILETMDEAIRRTEALIAKLQKVKAGLLHDLLTRGLDEHGQLRDPLRHPEQFKDSELGRIPKEWEVKRLEDVVSALSAGVSVNAWDKPVSGGQVGVLKTGCVLGGDFFPDENKTVIPKDVRRVSCPVLADSIIISRMNTPQLVGESGYVSEDHPSLFLPDRLWRIDLFPGLQTSARWLSYILQWKPVKDRIQFSATGTSGSMKNISKDDLLSVRVAFPSPTEQRALVERVQNVQQRITSEKDYLGKLCIQKQGVMRDLLTGRLRLQQSVLDRFEPGSKETALAAHS